MLANAPSGQTVVEKESTVLIAVQIDLKPQIAFVNHKGFFRVEAAFGCAAALFEHHFHRLQAGHFRLQLLLSGLTPLGERHQKVPLVIVQAERILGDVVVVQPQAVKPLASAPFAKMASIFQDSVGQHPHGLPFRPAGDKAFAAKAPL